ncbi:MAG: hypothetical protein HC933_22795 [Pleurocapsa sp. SU_196_0]|nr:hypothetical protein [Pleurocapsa sp. SU_196_0]
MDTRKDYVGERVTVSYDRSVCTHAAECVRGLPAVFDVNARPWIQPDHATREAVIATVALCPSKALRIERQPDSSQADSSRAVE